ncbi:MAG: hypothetical protein KatS3mg113_0463 [Planctomycetaceae bacterium]|nr:MAG: hypothetical protein KatS3mg113_0463 [Planctomycetaceae bacterium]
MIDVNVHLGSWPCRYLPDDTPERIRTRLHRHGVRQAWVGHFDALLHRDWSDVNRRLSLLCREEADFFLPVGSINPTWPDWETDWQRCLQEYGFRLLRLYPGFHDYTLEDESFRRVLELAQRDGVPLQIVVQLEDPRTQHPRWRSPPVDLRPLVTLWPQFPQVRLMFLNALGNWSPGLWTALVAAGSWCVDLATLEGIAGLQRLTRVIPYTRIVFGSHAPLFAFESAWLKLQESELPTAWKHAITYANAQAWLLGQ